MKELVDVIIRNQDSKEVNTHIIIDELPLIGDTIIYEYKHSEYANEYGYTSYEGFMIHGRIEDRTMAYNVKGKLKTVFLEVEEFDLEKMNNNQ